MSTPKFWKEEAVKQYTKFLDQKERTLCLHGRILGLLSDLGDLQKQLRVAEVDADNYFEGHQHQTLVQDASMQVKEVEVQELREQLVRIVHRVL
jgi:hypothetical protein